jgi:poly(A) polymerase
MLMLRELGKMRERADELGWAVLLHDVGKPPAAEPREDGQNRFRHHARMGTELSEKILRRFGCSREFIMTICDAVAVHMKLADAPKMKKANVRKILGHPEIMLHLALHRLDCMHCSGGFESLEFLIDAKAQYLVEPAVPPPLLAGKDLIERGVPQGPGIGVILREAEELQLEDKLKTREEALVWLYERLL